MVIFNKDVIASKTTPILWTIINNKELLLDMIIIVNRSHIQNYTVNVNSTISAV